MTRWFDFTTQLHKVEFKEREYIYHMFSAVLYIWLFCSVMKTSLTGRLHTLRFFIRFAFPAFEKWAERLGRKKKN